VEVLEASNFDFTEAASRVRQELVSMGIADADNPCVYQGMRMVERGFPLPELQFTADSVTQNAAIARAFDNVDFVGRAPGRFFMRDVVAHSFQVTTANGPRGR
jgi:hypothetical protein